MNSDRVKLIVDSIQYVTWVSYRGGKTWDIPSQS